MIKPIFRTSKRTFSLNLYQFCEQMLEKISFWKMKIGDFHEDCSSGLWAGEVFDGKR